MSIPVSTPVEKKGDSRSHRIRVRGEELLAKVREIIHKGNARRIIVINEQGASLLEIPLTAGVISALIAPVLVAVGAMAALAQNYTLLIEAHEAGAPSLPARTHRTGKRARVRKATPV